MSDTLVIGGQTYNNVTGIKATNSNNTVLTYTNGGSASLERKDVNFYDYDGTIVASYTTAEFANITALPANPSHTGLTAQGWNMPSNWTLADAKTYVSTNKKADWGQMYTTTSGATEIDIELTDPDRLTFSLSFAVNGTVSVDWGDESNTITVTSNSLTTRKDAGPHTYSTTGKYTIKITVTSGTWAFYAASSTQFLHKNSTQNENRVYLSFVQMVRIGTGCTQIYNYGLYNCSALTNITIPNNITNIGDNAFQYCYHLNNIIIPNSVTNIGSNAFSYCYSLQNVIIPNSVTTIGGSAFAYCYTLSHIIIPNSVTSIGTYLFQNDGSLKEVIMSNNITSISNYTFYACSSLNNITLSNNATSIGNNACQYCYALNNITIPNNVTSIATKAFQACGGLSSIHFKPTTPPTVAASDTFTNVPTDCKIYVPTGYLSAYTGATNYPDSSTYTYIEE